MCLSCFSVSNRFHFIFSNFSCGYTPVKAARSMIILIHPSCVFQAKAIETLVYNMAVGQKENRWGPQVLVYFSIFPFTKRIFFGYSPFLDHSHVYSTPGLCVEMAGLYPAPRRGEGGDTRSSIVYTNVVDIIWACPTRSKIKKVK